MRAATHGCNEGSIEAGWLGQSHLPVMLNYVPTNDEGSSTTHRTGGPPLVLNSEMARAFVLSARSSGRAAPPSGRAFALSVLGNGPSVRPLLLRSRSLFAAHVPCLLAYCARAAYPGPAAAGPPWPSPSRPLWTALWVMRIMAATFAAAAFAAAAFAATALLLCICCYCCCCICCCCCLPVCVSAQMLPLLLLPCLLRSPAAAAPPPFSVSFFK